MALRDIQAALARLYTDEAARAAFLADPKRAGASLGLDEAETDLLCDLAPRELRRFAAGLRAKRALDARKRTPLTALVLKTAFDGHFHAAVAARATSPAEQTRALARRLSALARAGTVEPVWVGDLARYEAAFVEASRRRFAIALRLFSYPVGKIAGALYAGASVGQIRPRWTLGLWVRLPGGRLKRFLWSLRR